MIINIFKVLYRNGGGAQWQLNKTNSKKETELVYITSTETVHAKYRCKMWTANKCIYVYLVVLIQTQVAAPREQSIYVLYCTAVVRSRFALSVYSVQ